MNSFGQDIEEPEEDEQGISKGPVPLIAWPWVLLFLASVSAVPWLGVLVWFGILRLSAVLSLL